jgi:hypothetical protein
MSTNEGDMKTTVIGSALAVAWCVAAPFAQQQPTPAPNAIPAHNVFVLAGCLKAGADPTGIFKLTDASSIGQTAPAGATDGAVKTSGQKPSYELRPVSGLNAQGVDADGLKAHLGQRVEVTVRPVETAPAAPPAGSAGIKAATPTERAPEVFSVTAIKRVSGTCAE